MAAEVQYEIEAAHIISDILFLRRLFQGIINHAKYAAIVNLCSFNYICLLTFEAAKHMDKLPPGFMNKPAAPASSTIAQSRHSIKLFDDNKRGLAGVTGVIEDEIIPAHAKEFLGNTWFPLARWLESDLGLFMYRKRLIATTHSIQYNLGLSVVDTPIGELRPAVRDVGTKCSIFVDSLARDYNWHGHSFLDHVELRKIRSKDVRAEKEYQIRFDRSLPRGLIASLISFQASLNFVDEFLSTDPEPASRGTITKLKYVTLRHTYASLKRISEEYRTVLARRSTDLLNEALAPPGDAQVLIAADNRLRNVLVHYGLGRMPTAPLTLTEPLFGLVSALTPGQTFESFEAAVSREVQRVSTILDSWSSP